MLRPEGCPNLVTPHHARFNSEAAKIFKRPPYSADMLNMTVILALLILFSFQFLCLIS